MAVLSDTNNSFIICLYNFMSDVMGYTYTFKIYLISRIQQQHTELFSH